MSRKLINTGRNSPGNLKVMDVDSPYLPRYVLGSSYTSGHQPRRDFRGCCDKDHLQGHEPKSRQIFKPLPKRESTILYYRLTPEDQDTLDGK